MLANNFSASRWFAIFWTDYFCVEHSVTRTKNLSSRARRTNAPITSRPAASSTRPATVRVPATARVNPPRAELCHTRDGNWCFSPWFRRKLQFFLRNSSFEAFFLRNQIFKFFSCFSRLHFKYFLKAKQGISCPRSFFDMLNVYIYFKAIGGNMCIYD